MEVLATMNTFKDWMGILLVIHFLLCIVISCWERWKLAHMPSAERKQAEAVSKAKLAQIRAWQSQYGCDEFGSIRWPKHPPGMEGN